MPIRIHEGSILDVQADAIVNPANSFLQHGGGLATIIATAAKGVDPADFDGMRAATDRAAAWQREQEDHALIATGNAGWTSAGALPYKGIVHAVGPIWNDGHFMERSLLKSAHLNACAVAHDHGCRSLAFPAISCGIFGFPVWEAAKLAVSALSEFWALSQPEGMGMDITFALFEQEHVAAYTAALEQR